MELPEIRKRLTQTIEATRREASSRRDVLDRASRDYQRFLEEVGVPVFRNVASVLRAEGLPFQLFTPADSVRLASDRSRDEFIELALDTARRPIAVVGRSSVVRGRHVHATEEPLREGQPLSELTAEDVVAFVQRALPAFIER